MCQEIASDIEDTAPTRLKKKRGGGGGGVLLERSEWGLLLIAENWSKFDSKLSNGAFDLKLRPFLIAE